MIADNQADLGLMHEPAFILNVDQGMHLIQVGTLIDKPMNCIIALQTSGIKSLQDFKGKEIGESDNRLAKALFATMLHQEGLKANDYKVVPLQKNLTAALLSHKVDAVSGVLRNIEVAALEKSGEKVVVFFPEEHGMPTYSELIFTSNMAKAKDPRFKKFLMAIKQAVRFIDEHPEMAWKQFVKQNPTLNTPMNHDLWFKTLPYFAENPEEFNRDEWIKFANFMQQNHFIHKTQTMERYSIIG